MASLNSSRSPFRSFANEQQAHPAWKRTLDVVLCLAAMPLLAVTTLLVALLMASFAPGPIFFRQERIGFMGRRFRLYKFRTMHVGADIAGHQAHLAKLMRTNAPLQKLDAKGDSRLIPLGWLLRASGMDELPQIINVLKQEMSIVGPRPCIPYEYEGYSAQQRKRFHSAPGLTGLWQISGKNRTTFDRMVQLDIEYTSRKSFLLDLKIVVLTPWVLISQIVEMLSLTTSSGASLPAASSTDLTCSEVKLEKATVAASNAQT